MTRLTALHGPPRLAPREPIAATMDRRMLIGIRERVERGPVTPGRREEDLA